VSDSVAVIWDDALAGYDFGRGHPFAPLRVSLAMDLVRAVGLLDVPSVELVSPRLATYDELLTVHTVDYVDAVRRCSGLDRCMDPAYGLGTDDNPVFPGMHEATSLVVGGASAAADAVWSGRQQHAVHLAGGLHHAMPGRAAGFCIYNDVAVAIEYLLAQGAERVAYVDVDVHHGDGVEAAFWDDPRVLTISLHESGATQFPGTGWPHDVGGPSGGCCAVNCALPAGLGDAGWLRAFDAIVPDLLRSFRPTVLVTQMGCDTHVTDPLGHFSVTLDGQAAMYERLHDLAHEVSEGRWVTTGGGGYAIVDVVPRSWTRLVAEVTGVDIATGTPVPAAWREHAMALTGIEAPWTMGEGTWPQADPWSRGVDADDPIDAAILATRHAVFPSHGLDPWG
jgi:acetoin utilization protein AcuC